MPMNCPEPICRLVDCSVTDDLPHYLGQYSLQTGVRYVNNIISVPKPGGGFYYVPPGTIVIVVPPTTSPGYNITYQGCLSTITRAVPAGATSSEVAGFVSSVMQQVAAQLQICNSVPARPKVPTFLNEVQSITISCPSGSPTLTGIAPWVLSLSGNVLSFAAGVVSSTVSVAAANATAASMLAKLAAEPSVVSCGYDCAGTPTDFSGVWVATLVDPLAPWQGGSYSASLNVISFSFFHPGSINYAGGSAVIFKYIICNPTNVPISIKADGVIAYDFALLSGDIQIAFHSFVTLSPYPGSVVIIGTYNAGNDGYPFSGTGTGSMTFTIPATSVTTLEFSVSYTTKKDYDIDHFSGTGSVTLTIL